MSARRIVGDLPDLLVQRLEAGEHPAIDALVRVVVPLVPNPVRIERIVHCGIVHA
jgi:hypothetical protein